MKAAFVIPVYRHGKALGAVISSLLPYNIPLIVVDDGNDLEERELIQKACAAHKGVTLITRKKNGGKGKAMEDGALEAERQGFTHIFQVDADGQHNAALCGEFLKEAEQHPDALICGCPVYDESVPTSRKKGREFSNGWARIVSLRPEIKDVLCGFRIYPLAPLCAVIHGTPYINGRMGYDAEIFVRLLWKGLPLINKDVNVTYPADGFSNFRMVRDNIGISVTFARLFVGMILRLPILLLRKTKRRRAS